MSANILAENNVFVGVNTPIDTKSHSDSNSILHSEGNLYMSTSGDMPAELKGTNVFKPPYMYMLDATNGLQAAIESGAGPR